MLNDMASYSGTKPPQLELIIPKQGLVRLYEILKFT